jgi:hypothetical protein
MTMPRLASLDHAKRVMTAHPSVSHSAYRQSGRAIVSLAEAAGQNMSAPT